ncbi:MAG: hypothetical protein J6X55_07420 [Victivallales bacterium]|nr:hypothetical protein [Victivallales bacterium]
MEFKKVGKTYQLFVQNGQDLKDVLVLDEALWGATSAPASIFSFDPAMTAILDPGKTGRITSNSVKDAINWFLAKTKNPASVTQDFNGELKLTDISDDAKPLIESAKHILEEMSASDRTFITLKQIRDYFAVVAKRPFNGDGVVSLTGAEAISADFKTILTDVITVTGGTPDADGTIGATEKNLQDFLAAARDYLAWLDAGAIPAGQAKSDIMPMGTDTPAYASLVRAITPQVDQFFKLSGLLGFDERIEPKSMAPEAKVNAFDPANQPEVDAYLQSLPIAKPDASNLLSLDLNVINPIYRNQWNDVTIKILKPVLGEDITAISPEQWNQVKALFAPYEAYLASKKGGDAEKVPVERLRAALADKKLPDMSADAAARDKLETDFVNAAKEVEKLLLLHTYLLRFVNNFVSFPEMYDPKKRAMFECGSLVIDGRWFNLAFPVDNPAAHQALAKKSLLCMLYVEVTKAPGSTFNVCIPVTFGSQGNLDVGKRGVFFSTDGHQYDAKVTHFISNPVCIREAMFAPFIKLWTIVEGKIEGWSSNAEKTFTGNFDKAISSPTALAQAPAQPPAPAAPAANGKGNDKSGMLLGASVAVAALGSAFAFISNTLSNMSANAIWVTVLCAILVLLAPITILAMIKLSKQDLSSVLEGSGWAINLRMKLTTRLRGQFTNFGKYPKDAKGKPMNRAILWTIIILLIIGASIGVSCYREHRQNLKEQAEKAEAAKKAAEEAAAAKKAADEAAAAKKTAEEAAAKKAAEEAAAKIVAAEAATAKQAAEADVAKKAIQEVVAKKAAETAEAKAAAAQKAADAAAAPAPAPAQK